MRKDICGGPRILVIDPDPAPRAALTEYLEENGYAVAEGPPADLDRLLDSFAPDLVVMEAGPVGDPAVALCRRFADRGGPSLILQSAPGEETGRILGLEIGADDCVSRPVSPREILARVRAVLRRRSPDRARRPDSGGAGAAVAAGGYTLSLVDRTLTAPGGEVVVLSAGEATILAILLRAGGDTVSRPRIASEIRIPQGSAADRAIDMRLSRLRRKLAAGPSIATVRGRGYRIAAPHRTRTKA